MARDCPDDPPPGAAPTLVVTCGAPGAGKSTVAELIAEHLDAELLRTDVVRKELFDDPDYDPEETEAVYAELLDRADRHLRAGRSAVLDGTFRWRDRREAARERAASAGGSAVVVRVTCDPAVSRERVREREGDASDADVAVHDRVREQFEPIEGEHVAIDNDGSLAATRRQVEAAFGN